MYVETALVLFGYFFLIFLMGQVLKDNSIVDIGWGSGFVLAAGYSFFRSAEIGTKGMIITACISLWGLRLTYHIAKRNIGKPEDYRYVEMRKHWGRRLVLLKAFFHVYFLQFVIQYIVALPVIYGNTTKQQLTLLNWLGLFIWMIGLFFEAYGDHQLKQFKKHKENKGKIMDKGLWAMTRHPNYFGDSLMWFGIFFMAVSGFEGGWILISPLLMTFFLVFVSGVKMLEKKYEGRVDYERYKQRTSAFFPWFPKSVKE